MEATLESIQIEMPKADMAFLRKLAAKMGWNIVSTRRTGIEKGLEDIRKGHIFKAKDSADLLQQIVG